MLKYYVQVAKYVEGYQVTITDGLFPEIHERENRKLRDAHLIPGCILDYLAKKGQRFRGTIPAPGEGVCDQSYWVMAERI